MSRVFCLKALLELIRIMNYQPRQGVTWLDHTRYNSDLLFQTKLREIMII